MERGDGTDGTHHFCVPGADGQAKLLTGMRELADKLLELFFFVCGQCGIISKKVAP